MSETSFEGWATVELIDHQQIAGLISGQAVGGVSFVRVDVPEIDDKPRFTMLFGGGAVYAITPTTQELATIAVRRLDIRPLSMWLAPEREDR